MPPVFRKLNVLKRHWQHEVLVSTGNIRNDELKVLFLNNLGKIEAAFADARFIELTRDSLIIHA